jgi:hypothetical protein
MYVLRTQTKDNRTECKFNLETVTQKVADFYIHLAYQGQAAITAHTFQWIWPEQTNRSLEKYVHLSRSASKALSNLGNNMALQHRGMHRSGPWIDNGCCRGLHRIFRWRSRPRSPSSWNAKWRVCGQVNPFWVAILHKLVLPPERVKFNLLQNADQIKFLYSSPDCMSHRTLM